MENDCKWEENGEWKGSRAHTEVHRPLARSGSGLKV